MTQISFDDFSRDHQKALIDGTPVNCPTCGAQNTVREFSFCKAVRDVFVELVRVGGESDLKDLNVTKSAYSVSSNLKHWGLIEPVINEETKKRRGRWRVTDFGHRFYRGHEFIIPKLYIFRNEVIRREGDKITIHDFPEDTKMVQDHKDFKRDQL